MDHTHRRNVRAAALALSLFASAYAQSTVTKPGQPSKTNAPLGQFEIVGDSIVSAQQVGRTLIHGGRLQLTRRPLQLFLGTLDKVYIVDKTEANPTKVNGHPAWAAGACMRPWARIYSLMTRADPFKNIR